LFSPSILIPQASAGVLPRAQSRLGQFLLETHNLKRHSSGWRASPCSALETPGGRLEMRKISTRDIALCIVCCALYAALVNVFAPISFQQIQVRVANALIGSVPLLGWPAVCGLALGVFLGNLTSPLGPIDLLSTLPSFLGLLVVYRLRQVSVLLGLQIYSTLVSIWVAFMLNFAFQLPYITTFAYVFVGVTIATTGLGYILYKSLSKLGITYLLKES
jgi:uncharacterized membrane protein